ncbi:MAG: DHHA1 domain-containing protein, partial [Syntrophothermus sp.]
SLVDENRLRFDFTHFAKMTKEEIGRVEKIVNARIRENIPIREDRSVPVETAREMGAMALFGEKYGDTVRVIAFDKDFSIELCGGTHVAATGQIGLFKIISEGAVAAGIRRIEAITAEKAENWFNEKLELMDEIREKLKNPKDLLQGVNSLVEENQELRRQMAGFEKIQALQMKAELIGSMKEINGVNFLAAQLSVPADSAKDLAFQISKEVENHFLFFAGETDGKVHLTLMISPELNKSKGWDAGKMIRELAKEVQGGGGGQPHIATAGGKNPAGIPAVLQAAANIVNQ